MRLMIGIPSNRDHNPRFTISLLALQQQILVQGIKGDVLETLQVRVEPGISHIAMGRTEFVREAIRAKMTHLLFLDDDMTFPRDMLDHLCKWKLPIVAANYCRKLPNLEYTAVSLDEKFVKSKGRTGIERVARVGAGILLIDLSVLRDIPEPWFGTRWDPIERRILGEDYFFCEVLQSHGVQIHIDHGLSNQIGHVGDFAYRFDSYPGA